MADAAEKLSEARAEAFLKRLNDLFYEERTPLSAEYCLFSPMVPFSKRQSCPFQPILPGTPWGKNWQQAWFHLSAEIPSSWKGKRVCARLDLGGEGLVYSPEGVPVQALSIHSIWAGPEFRRDRYEVCEKAQGGEKVELWIEASAGQLFGLKLLTEKGMEIPEEFGQYEALVGESCLAVFRRDIWDLYLDFLVLSSLMQALPPKAPRRRRILRALTSAMDMFIGYPDADLVQRCRDVLKRELEKRASATDLSTLAVGHAHLDTAWLWPVAETVSKSGRTFATQLSLIEQYPGYVFGASAAQHYAFVKERYPELWSRISEKVAQGKWEVQGAMWVESDCNLPGGESLVRQIIHGKRFFRDEFGIDVNHLWLPDVFGFSAALPQIMKKSGIDFLVTQKLSWNQVNRHPHHTFRWRGIDGTEVICLFPPEDNYSSELMPASLIRARENFDESGFLEEFLTLFGIGDGGGGPTPEMIESGMRQKSLEGCPRVSFGQAADFLKRLAEKKEQLPLWSGELYLELHRGTYTTQAYNKCMNRFMEHKLRELEIFCSALPLKKYPSADLDRMWKILLLNQFHDIIPGSSVTPVYQESRRQYEELAVSCSGLLQKAAEALFARSPKALCVVNTLSYFFRGAVELPDSWLEYEVTDEQGQPVPIQQEEGKTVALATIPPLAALNLYKGNIKPQPPVKLPSQPLILENDRIRCEFSDKGALKGVFDKKLNRDIMAAGQEGNRLELFEDRPVNWDAWDIDIFYENQLCGQARLKNAYFIATGPVRSGIKMHWSLGNSDIVQRVFLNAGSRRLDFETEIDWREDHKLLRVAFPTDVRSDLAAFDIQFGTVRRPTLRNTGWEAARFEVVGHRFADLSGNDFGVALLTDGKYGFKVLENELSLSLLRSPASPDPKADRGHHRFIYSLVPHPGPLVQSEVFSQAAQLNQPPAYFLGLEGRNFRFPFALDNEEIVLETVKKSETEEALIVRLYEPQGKETRAEFAIPPGEGDIWEADLMEKFLGKLEDQEGRVELCFRPFEIKTLKILRRKKT